MLRDKCYATGHSGLYSFHFSLVRKRSGRSCKCCGRFFKLVGHATQEESSKTRSSFFEESERCCFSQCHLRHPVGRGDQECELRVVPIYAAYGSVRGKGARRAKGVSHEVYGKPPNVDCHNAPTHEALVWQLAPVGRLLIADSGDPGFF